MAFVDIGINALENRDYEGGGFSGTRLSLGNNVSTRDAGQDGSLLDSRGLLKTIGVNASEKLILQTHLIEGVDVDGDLNDKTVRLDFLKVNPRWKHTSFSNLYAGFSLPAS